jgi:carboxylate-amine ligase
MNRPLQLFEAFGVELEYMIVDRHSLDVRPVADQLLQAAAGEIVSEIDLGEISWSNELALHVIELKSSEPTQSLARLPEAFQQQLDRIGDILDGWQAAVLPTAMHPWMDPEREMRLWPHDYNPIYEAYNRIFDCRGHGWANLQSVHLNLPFAGDDQFGRLHAAIRILLPLLPALAASSPIVQGQATGFADNRMRVYRDNSKRVPSLTGAVVPEAVFTRAEYERQIFQVMYADIGPYDNAGILQHEWLNSRGAIARFDRDAIEIRVLDVQEAPQADVAICEAIVAVLKLLVSERWTSYAEQQQVPTAMLAELLGATTREAEWAVVDNPLFLRQLGIEPASLKSGVIRCDQLWQTLIEQVASQVTHLQPLQVILNEGTLARRILRSLETENSSLSSSFPQPFSIDALRRAYRPLLLT